MKRLLFFALLLLVFISSAADSQTLDTVKAIKAANVKVDKLYRRGKYTEGLRLALTTLKRAKRELGPEHSYTLASMNNVANLYSRRGRYKKAERLFKRALKTAERVHGKKHLSTLTIVNNLAALYDSQGRYGKAELLYKRALKVSKRVRGKKHPSTLISMNNLAMLYRNQGRYRKAEPLFKRTLKVSERVLGKKHPSTLTSANNLACFYSSQGRYKEAEPLYKRTLMVREQVLGKKHRDVLASANNLAALYRKQGRYREAEPLYKRVLKVSKREFGKEQPFTLTISNNLAALYFDQGRYGQAELLYKRVLEARERVLGKEHPDTLTSVNNLALLYSDQGRYGQAELLHKRTLEVRERKLGGEHPNTLQSLNNLALLYSHQGRYGEAELLARRALKTAERVYGKKHPDTLRSVHNMASLYENQGRYGEAEPLYKRTLEVRERIHGKKHPDTLGSVNNLASLYSSQGRYEEAEPLYKRTLEVRERELGKEHPDTLISINNLAALYESQGRYGEAEPLFKRALEVRERALGKEHPHTLTNVNNLAFLYSRQGRYGEAEPLYKRALEVRERELGKEHPDTLNSVSTLAGLYSRQGRYGEAEPLFKRALEVRERVLGKEHPDTLRSLGNLSVLLTRMGKTSEAFLVFRTWDNRLAFWLNAETRSTQGAVIRRKILANNSGEQNAMFSFALRHPSQVTSRFAVDLTLRWKKRLAHDATSLNNLVRTSQDPRIVEAAKLVWQRQEAIANAVLNDKIPVVTKEAMKQSLEAAEAELRQRSAKYRYYQQMKSASAQDVQHVLPQDSTLIEYRFFKPYNFKTEKFGKLHLLAVVLRPNKTPALVDLGEAAPVFEAQRYLIDAKLREKDKVALPKLQRDAHKLLIAPLVEHLKGVKTLIISPDGFLHALPFDALLDENGAPLINSYAIRMVQTGRDLVTRGNAATGKGLVAFGGIDFSGRRTWNAHPPKADPRILAYAGQKQYYTRSLTETLDQMERFPSLAHSEDELDAIEKLYVDRRPDEPAPIIYKGSAATEKRLKTLASPPRVLHLATHGAYLKKGSVAGRPLLQSFVTLAGANKGIHGKLDADGENGILHAIEAQSLNLFGTELVVLSACKTGQGVYDYSEGLEGLPRAFHVAGAKNVLVTLWNVGDESTQAFMTTFYDYWTRQASSDPGVALIETKRYFMSERQPQVEWRDPQIWAAFVLYEG